MGEWTLACAENEDSGRSPRQGEIKNYKTRGCGGKRGWSGRKKKLAHPVFAWPNVRCNAGETGGGACAHVNGKGVRKVVESVEAESGCTDGARSGDDAWDWYVRIHVRDRRYSFYLVYHEFYVRPSEHLFV